jgi:mannosyltransferase
MIFLILVVGLFLRLVNISQSLWLDEAIQAWAASSFTLRDLIFKFMPTDVHPPLSYIVSFFTSKLIGFSEISLRLPSVVFGVFTIYFTYKIAQKIKLKNPTLPAVLLATSGLHVYYSQEARMYSLATLLVCLSLYFLIKSLKKAKNFTFYTIYTLLAVYSHYYTWFMLPVHLIIVKLTNPSKLKKLIVSQFVVFIGFIPILPLLFKQLKGGLQAALSNPNWANTVGGLNLKSLSLIPTKFLIGRISFDNRLIYGLVVAIPLLISTYLLSRLLKNKSKNQTASIVILSWLFTPLILAILVSLKVPVLGFHRFLFILPSFYLSLSLGISYLGKPLQKLIILILLGLNITTTGIYLFNQSFHREDWKALTQELSLSNQSQAPVAILAPVRTPLEYYYAGEIINYQDINPKFTDSQVWLVPYAEPIFDPELQTKTILTKQGFKPIFEKHFRGNLTLIQYTNENWN